MTLLSKHPWKKRYNFSVQCGRPYLHEPLDTLFILQRYPCGYKLFKNSDITFTSSRFSHEKRSDNASAAYRNPNNNFGRMQWFFSHKWGFLEPQNLQFCLFMNPFK
ncbi:hypothetical protein NPIL_406491 [Nephila pilipes]|uniref:Uncharacterized protein n=1 Tax=Nephila pilipes TaxID=299642 RepID=A0A8X6TSP2_NEPPI|nr:hypothetical protein NPIL_406491 [Nephila pilipes]